VASGARVTTVDDEVGHRAVIAGLVGLVTRFLVDRFG
jgi:hypothetical protein